MFYVNTDKSACPHTRTRIRRGEREIRRGRRFEDEEKGEEERNKQNRK
jgi:hypothetical protein